MKRSILFCLIALFAIVFVSGDLFGMPAFARKYKMSCKTCHEPFPHLNAFGEEFAGDGFVLKDQEAPRSYTDTGDDKLSLFRELPIAIRFDGYVKYNNANTRTSDFATPMNVKLLSGGSLAKNISYYFYFFFSEQGNIVGLEDAFLMFTDIFHSGITFTIGQFQVSDPLFKRELRLTFEDYQIYKARGGFSTIDLTYDRGIMFNYAIPKGPDLVFEVLNGTGIGEANIFENFDDDKYKNVFGRISQEFGKHLRIGGSAYSGKEVFLDAMNKIFVWGADATVSFPSLQLNFQFMERSDKNPLFSTVSPVEEKIRGGFAELVYTPPVKDNRLYAVGLFNWVNYEDKEENYRSGALQVGYLLRRNIRMLAEVDYIFKGPEGKHARVLVGLIAGF